MNDSSTNQGSMLDEENQRRRALVLRTLPILLIPVLAAMLTIAVLRFSAGWPGVVPEPQRYALGPLVPIVVIVVFFSALIILVRLGRPTISALLVISVWTLITTLGALRSGVTSFVPALLVIPICAAGLLIDRVASVSLAALAILLVGSLAWLEQNSFLSPPPAPPAFIAANINYLALGFWIGLFVTVAALTSLLAGGLQRALRESRARAEELQALSNDLEMRVETQTAQLLEQERAAATLAERTRLAREIHDTLAQGLTGIVVQLGAAQRALTTRPEAADEHIGLAQQMARESLSEARRSVWNLRAQALERGDLGDALRSLTARSIHAAAATTFEQHGEAWPIAPDVESALVRVAQEALANAARHAGAANVTVVLDYLPDTLHLSVSDDGVGFPKSEPAEASGPWSGFGLLGMRERIAALGGQLEIQNDHGARIVAIVPRKNAG